MFVGVRGAPPIGRQHPWASELLKTHRSACGIRAALYKKIGGLGWGGVVWSPM